MVSRLSVALRDNGAETALSNRGRCARYMANYCDSAGPTKSFMADDRATSTTEDTIEQTSKDANIIAGGHHWKFFE
jgi:hypothetical protein